MSITHVPTRKILEFEIWSFPCVITYLLLQQNTSDYLSSSITCVQRGSSCHLSTIKEKCVLVYYLFRSAKYTRGEENRFIGLTTSIRSLSSHATDEIISSILLKIFTRYLLCNRRTNFNFFILNNWAAMAILSWAFWWYVINCQQLLAWLCIDSRWIFNKRTAEVLLLHAQS